MPVSLLVEIAVILLLMITIGYCFILNRHLTRLRDDEATLKATIKELFAATGAAERAIVNLRKTAEESDDLLSLRLNQADQMTHALRDETLAGELVLNRISRITAASKRDGGHASAPTPPSLQRHPIPKAQPETPKKIKDDILDLTVDDEIKLSSQERTAAIQPEQVDEDPMMSKTKSSKIDEMLDAQVAAPAHNAKHTEEGHEDLSSAAFEVVQRLQALRRRTGRAA